MDYTYLLYIAIILIFTKAFGLLSKVIKLPQVVGALVAGIILGPVCLNLVSLDNAPILSNLSEIGVIVLMFVAGLETDIREMKKCGLASSIIALIGVIVPLVGGAATAFLFGTADPTLSTSTFLQDVFVGVILTATSVSITVETLKELGKLNTRAGNAILGAALIDDVLGIIALTVITSLADPESGNIGIVILKILGFFAFALLFGVFFHFVFNKWTQRTEENQRRYVIVSFALCLLFAYVAEEFFGVADITGSFVAGLVISSTSKTKYIAHRFDTMSYLLLSPIFFASIGLKVTLTNMTPTIIIFAVVLLIVAILSKVVGCGLGAKICRYTNKEALQIGVGMISRGEVALIVADKGLNMGLMSSGLFGPIVIMVVITTVVTPILLKFIFKDKNDASGEIKPKEAAEVTTSDDSLEYVPGQDNV